MPAWNSTELITTRKELLEKTLQGLVKMLTDILGITNPVAQLREPTAVPSAGESLSVSQKLRILMPA